MANLKKPNKSIQRKGLPPKEEEASNNLAVVTNPTSSKEQGKAEEKKDIRPLNFKVENEFRKRFKNYATNNDMTMSDLLVQCFEEFVKARK
jgi:hypothetical protein